MCCGGYEPSREGKTKVSRRRMVKAMGAGAGLLTIGGMTGCTQLISGTNQGVSLDQNPVWATMENSVKERDLRQLQNAKKDAFKAIQFYKEGKAKQALKFAGKSLRDLFRYWDNIGVSSMREGDIRIALREFKGLEPEVIEELKANGVTDRTIHRIKSIAFTSRKQLLSEHELNVNDIEQASTEALELLSNRTADGIESDTVLGQGLLGCIGTALATIGTGVATTGACLGCVGPDPTKVSCLGCYGGAIATTGGLVLTADQCF